MIDVNEKKKKQRKKIDKIFQSFVKKQFWNYYTSCPINIFSFVLRAFFFLIENKNVGVSESIK